MYMYNVHVYYMYTHTVKYPSKHSPLSTCWQSPRFRHKNSGGMVTQSRGALTVLYNTCKTQYIMYVHVHVYMFRHEIKLYFVYSVQWNLAKTPIRHENTIHICQCAVPKERRCKPWTAVQYNLSLILWGLSSPWDFVQKSNQCYMYVGNFKTRQ